MATVKSFGGTEPVIKVHAKIATATHTTQSTTEQLALRAPKIVIIGVGGTGGWLVPHAARLVKRLGVGSLALADGDCVERKNLGRQNFVESDLGQNKAIALAQRYAGAFGLPIRAIPGMLEDVCGLTRQAPQIVCGCVDKHKARRTIAEYMANASETVWIDAGNETVAGQVVLGYTGPVFRSGNTAAGPLPFAMPTVSQTLDLPVDGGTARPSCADLGAVTEQVSTVNIVAAGLMANFLRLILEDVKRTQLRQPVKGLEFGAVYFNVGNGGFKTVFNTPATLATAQKPMCPWQ